jgi:hypothetical protein
MSGLAPSTKYWYRFGDKTIGLTNSSDQYRFTSAPKPGKAAVKLVVKLAVCNFCVYNRLISLVAYPPVCWFVLVSAGAVTNSTVVIYGDMGLDFSEHTRAWLAEQAKQDGFDWVSGFPVQ